jgi:hypothetical protein
LPCTFAVLQIASDMTILVGASETAEGLRRVLAREGAAHVGVGPHMRGVRQALRRGGHGLVIVCVSLDRETLTRHGTAIRSIARDRNGLPGALRLIGLLPRAGMLDRTVAEIGCDAYVDSSLAALGLIGLYRREVIRHGAGGRLVADPPRRQTGGRFSQWQPSDSRRVTLESMEAGETARCVQRAEESINEIRGAAPEGDHRPEVWRT